MKKFIIAILFGWSIFGLAHAGPVKGVPTELAPLKKEEVKTPPVAAVVVPEKKVPQCFTVQSSSVSYSQGFAVNVPGMLVNICNCCGSQSVWLPGVFVSVPGVATENFTSQEICR